MCKTMAERLKKRYLGDVVFVREPMELDIDKSYHKLHQPEELMLAYSALNERTRRKASYRPRSIRPIVAKSYVTVFTGIVAVLKSLRRNGTVQMDELYRGQPGRAPWRHSLRYLSFRKRAGYSYLRTETA